MWAIFLQTGRLLEFAVYGAGMIRMADLILQGILLPGRGSSALFVVRVLVAESMVLLFPLWKLVCRWKKEERGGRICGEWKRQIPERQNKSEEKSGDRKGKTDSVWKEGETFLGILLLLGLTLQGWQEQDLVRALGSQTLALLLFFCYAYLRERRENETSCWNAENTVQGKGFVRNTEQVYQRDYMRNMEQQYQRTRELWHDLKNHIRVLEILAEEGRFGELTDYLDSFRRDVERRMVPARTGCAPVDALLGDKLYDGGKKGVEMKLELCPLAQAGIEPLDLCVILGNLLDNALEACGEISGEKQISLRIRREEEFYYITVVNTAKEPVREGAGYFSEKLGRDNFVGHGLGLRSVQRAAHRYGGLLVTDYKDGEFRVVVRLQDVQDEERYGK